MIDNDKALVERLRDFVIAEDIDLAGDRIEALSAENERLREALMLCAKHVDWMPHPHCVEVETAIRAALGGKK